MAVGLDRWFGIALVLITLLKVTGKPPVTFKPQIQASNLRDAMLRLALRRGGSTGQLVTATGDSTSALRYIRSDDFGNAPVARERAGHIPAERSARCWDLSMGQVGMFRWLEDMKAYHLRGIYCGSLHYKLILVP